VREEEVVRGQRGITGDYNSKESGEEEIGKCESCESLGKGLR